MSSIEKDERLLPLPKVNNLPLMHPQEVPANYSPIYEDDVLGEGRSLRDYFLIIYKRLPIILAVTILITAAVAFYMYRLPPIYLAQTVMVIEPQKPKATQQNVYINFGNDGNYYNTQLRLLKNQELMRDVVVKLGLYKDPNLFNKGNKGVVESLRSMFSNKPEESKDSLPVLTENTDDVDVVSVSTLTPEEKARAESYADILLSALNVETVPTTNLVNISMQNSNPDLIPKVTNTLADLHIKGDIKRAIQGSEEAFNDISKSIETLKATLTQQEMQRIDEMKKNDLPISGDKGADFNAQRLSDLSSKYLQAEDESRRAKAEYERALEASKKGEILSVVGTNNPHISAARSEQLKRTADLEKRIEAYDTKIGEANEKKRVLLTRYTEQYGEVKQIESQINELTKQRDDLKAEVSAKIKKDEDTLMKNAEKEILTGLQATLTSKQRLAASLRVDYQNEIKAAQARGIDATKLVTLGNEIQTNRNLLNTYIQRQKEMELAIQSGRPDNLSISTYATKPDTPIGPQRSRNIFIAFILTLSMGIGLAFLLDYLDDSVKTSDDIGKHLGLPTLALVPHHSLLGKKSKTKALSEDSPASATALVTITDNRSAIAEAYRHLRTSLLFSSAGKPPQTILVTSSQPSEGKTTTAINTAIALAQSGTDVVIIDCDLRRPRLHSHFGMDNSTGLTNYLSGERNLENIIKPYPTFPKLKVITSGPIPPNPAELLGSNDMKDIVRDLRGKYKHIVIDSPPAISFTDAAILATLTDGVIVVAMAGKSSLQLIKRVKQRFNSIGAKIYGVVLNGIRPDSFEYGYYGYGYEYSYEYDEDEDSTPRMEDDYESLTKK